MTGSLACSATIASAAASTDRAGRASAWRTPRRARRSSTPIFRTVHNLPWGIRARAPCSFLTVDALAPHPAMDQRGDRSIPTFISHPGLAWALAAALVLGVWVLALVVNRR